MRSPTITITITPGLLERVAAFDAAHAAMTEARSPLSKSCDAALSAKFNLACAKAELAATYVAAYLSAEIQIARAVAAA